MIWGWGHGAWLGGLSMALFWVGTVVLIVWAVRGMSPQHPDGACSALDIVEERFARGEIDASELTDLRRELSRR